MLRPRTGWFGDGSPSGNAPLSANRTSRSAPVVHQWQTLSPIAGPAKGAAQPLSLAFNRHFQIEKETTAPIADRGVLLMRQSFVPLMAVGALYALMYWWWGMYACLAFQLVLVDIAIIWWLLLLTGHVLWAKALFLLNWYLSITAMTVALTKESGIPIMSAVLAGIWISLFDIDLSRPSLCLIVVVVSSGLWIALQFCDGPLLLRESFSSAQLAHVNAVMYPLTAITTIDFVCVLICWLKLVNRKRESQLRHECSLVDRIVLGLLPFQIVERLKNGENLIADWRPMACILFMDIVGFTEMCSAMPPRQVVQGLVRVFSQIETVIKKYPRVQKIKTIGDAFMCASGLLDSQPSRDDIVQVAQLALELQATSFSMQTDDEIMGSIAVPIHFRFGMHCGEVVAGVISKERFTFDVVGDTVNIASRMESTGRPNTIQVSVEVKSRLERFFEFRDNGVQNVKGKGQMQTYLLVAALGGQRFAATGAAVGAAAGAVD